MSSEGIVTLASRELNAFVLPLRRVASDPQPPYQLYQLVVDLGWGFELSAEQAEAVGGGWEGILDAVETLARLGEPADPLEFAENLAALAEAVTSVKDVAPALEDLLEEIAGADAGDLLEELGTDLANYLVISWLERRHPMVRELLAALGIIRSVELPELRLGDETIVRRRLAADRLQSEVIPALLADPTGELSAFYGLLPLADTVTAEALGLLVGDRIRRVTGRLGGRTSTGARGELGPDGGREVALSLPFIEPGTVTEGGRIDLRLRVLSSADTGESGERGPGIELELPDWEPITFSLGGRTLAFDTTSLPDVLFVGRDGADTGGAGPVEISMEAQPRTDRRLVIGGATGLDLSWPVLRLSLEAEDEADYGVELVSRGSKVAVKAGEGDSFLRALIAGLDFEVEFDLGLEWSRSRGLTLSGTAALENRIALNLSLGPLSLTWLDLILALDGDVIRFSTGSELELRFEPFDVTIEGLGAEATLDFASETRNLGFCDLRLVFRPPTRIVLVIDSDVV